MAASSAPAVAAVAAVAVGPAAVVVGPAVVAALALVLTLTVLCLLPVLLPLVTLPLPLSSAVAGAEPAVAMVEAPPKAEVEAVAPAKAGKPNETPGEGKVKAPTAGGSATSPAGLGCDAGAADEEPLPAHQQPVNMQSHERAAEHMWQNP